MLKIVNAIKEFLLDNVNAKIDEIAEQEGLTVPKIEKKQIVHGIVDTSRYTGKCVVSIITDEQRETDGNITEWQFETDLTVTFLASGASYENLVKYACIYASAFKRAMQDSPTFNLKFRGSGLGSVKMYYDAGATSEQMTAVEIELTVVTEE